MQTLYENLYKIFNNIYTYSILAFSISSLYCLYYYFTFGYIPTTSTVILFNEYELSYNRIWDILGLSLWSFFFAYMVKLLYKYQRSQYLLISGFLFGILFFGNQMTWIYFMWITLLVHTGFLTVYNNK